MSTLQKIALALLPKSWAASLEKESRTWQAQCECGHSNSIWDLGGIRWKASGKPRNYFFCPVCQQNTWHVIRRKP